MSPLSSHSPLGTNNRWVVCRVGGHLHTHSLTIAAVDFIMCD